MRNLKGQFIKGSKPVAGFQKGKGYWTGKKRSDKFRKRMAEVAKITLNGFQKGNTINKGKHLSDETKKKLSKALKGQRLGTHLSEETKKRISLSNIGLKKGVKLSAEHIKKISDKNSCWWKGDTVGYSALHKWVIKHLGQPDTCEHCGKKGYKTGRSWNIQWANKDHKYKRILTAWLRLCVKCHKEYDIKNKLLK